MLRLSKKVRFGAPKCPFECIRHFYIFTQYGIVVLGGKGDTPEIAGMSDKLNYYSITGLYVFPNSVLKHIFEIEKSERQRYEITSGSQIFNQQNKLRTQKLSSDCIWLDTNTFDGIMKSSLHIQKLC